MWRDPARRRAPPAANGRQHAYEARAVIGAARAGPQITNKSGAEITPVLTAEQPCAVFYFTGQLMKPVLCLT